MNTADRFHAKIDRSGDCWEWTASRDKNGYGWFRAARNNVVRANRFAFELAYGSIAPGLHVCHRCDNPSCVRPDHLFAATNTDNRRDSVAKGRAAHGRTHGMSKLTEDQIPDIRAARAHGETLAEIAARYGIDQSLVSKIAKRRIWEHVV